MSFRTELDRFLAAHGYDATIRRAVGTSHQTYVDLECRVHVRGYEPSELVSDIRQGDSRVTMSPTEIEASGWPGAGVEPLAGLDRRLPRQGDMLIYAGQTRAVVAHAAPFYDGSEMCRIEFRVRG